MPITDEWILEELREYFFERILNVTERYAEAYKLFGRKAPEALDYIQGS